MKINLQKYCITIIIVLIFLTVLTSSVGAQGWLFQNPYPTSESLSGVKFVSPQKGWIIGMEGTILYTEDGGNTWDIQESGTNQYLTSLFFIDEKTGWIVGTKGTILYTEDGGKKWVSQDSGSTNPLHKVFFINSKEGWIVGNDVNKDEGFLLYTKDGGNKWEKQSPKRWLKIASVFFIDSNTGWFLAGDKVFRTKDSGKNWKHSYLPIPDSERRFFRGGIPKLGGGWMGDIFFVDSQKGWAVVGSWYIFYTDNGGETWKAQFSGSKMSYGLGHFFFADAKKGCVGGSTIFCTEDGLSWKEQLGVRPMGRKDWFKGFIVELWGGDFVNNDTAWAVGPYGLIMKTEDGGKKWEVKTRVIEGILTFVNDKEGWNAKEGNILYTDDGGNTWKVQTKTRGYLMDLFFLNHLKGWAVGWYSEQSTKGERIIWGQVLHTQNGGKTWMTQLKESGGARSGGFSRVYFIDENKGWVVGNSGLIFHTKDGGKNWERQKSGTRFRLNGVHFVNNKMGWAIGNLDIEDENAPPETPLSEGIIIHTDNGGDNWRIQWNKKYVFLEGVFFVDSNKGWVEGDGLFLYTEDGGKTWVENKSIEGWPVGIPFFIDKTRGWILHEGGTFITEDGGKTWVKQKTGLHKYPWRPFMENEKKTPQK